MIPQLEPISGRLTGMATAPPLRFRPLAEKISHCTLQNKDYVRQQGVTEAQRAGLRYEASVQGEMLRLFADYLSGPVLTFVDGSAFRSLRPDGLLLCPDRAFIFEIKHAHCPEAWWQLEKLYKVVLKRIVHCPVSLVEICRTYDPAVPFPVPTTTIDDIVEWCSKSRDSEFGVWTWRKPT